MRQPARRQPKAASKAGKTEKPVKLVKAAESEKALKPAKTGKERKSGAVTQRQKAPEGSIVEEVAGALQSGEGVGGGAPVDREQVDKAVRALLKWLKQQQKEKAKTELIEDDTLLHVVVSLKKIPDTARTNGHRIPLPHSLYPRGEGREVCLIVKDDKRGEPEHKKSKERLAAEGETGVTKVIGVSKLRAKYAEHEAKRKLCGSYDLFLADDRIICLLPKLLGKTFFKKKKHPIPVDLQGKSWGEKIKQACDSTYLYLGGGPCSVVRAARSTQSRDEIVENVLAVIEGVGEKVPKKWKNIQSLHLKATDSLALPLYVTKPAAVELAQGSA